MDTSWIVGLITAGITTAITTIVTLVLTRKFKKYTDDRDKEQAELMELRDKKLREDRKKDISEIVSAKIKPLEDKIDAIDSKLVKVEDGTLSTLRNDILTCYYRCVEKGYRNDYDYQNVHHMFEAYAELNGNSYVEDVVKRFDNLPVKEEVKEISVSKPRKKKVLNENK